MARAENGSYPGQSYNVSSAQAAMSKRPRKRENRQPAAAATTGLHPAEPVRYSRRAVALATFALVLVIAGARWWLIGKYSSDVPWLDQWDAEAQGLYQPWQAGTLDLHHWFTPHNEHRILFTRLLAFGLLQLNGQWDPRLQMIVNAVLAALVAAGLFLALHKSGGSRFLLLCWVLLAVLGAAPYSATNVLLGFQSQFYFLAGFSFLAIYCLVNSRPGSPAWIAGVLSGCAALVSMASGHAAPLAAIGVLLLSAARAPQAHRHLELRQNAVTIVAASLLVAAGFYFRHSPPGHAALAAKTAGDFARFLVDCLSWPGKPLALLAAFSWLPFALFLAAYIRGRTNGGPGERFILGIGCWVLLQAAALSLFRANSEEGLESRYMEILSWGLLANAVCAAWLFQTKWELRKFVPVLASLWFAVSAIGLYSVSFDGAAFQWKQAMEARRAATAGFLALGNQEYLDRAPPYTDARHLAALLLDPGLRAILPVGIRNPLVLEPRGGSPVPEYINGLSSPNVANATPGVWTLPGMFSRFALIQPSTRFGYRVEKRSALPLLLLYRIGNGASLSISDAKGATHTAIPLPGGGDPRGSHAFAYCPTRECVLTGSSGASQIAIMETKEIGWLSVAALVAALWGPFVMAGGLALFLAAATAAMRGPRAVAKRV